MSFRSALMVAAAVFGFSAGAHAVPIAAGSQISFAGGAMYNDVGITFLHEGKATIVADTSTGSFANPFEEGCYKCGRFADFSYAPFTGPVRVYTATLDHVTTTLTLTSLNEVQVTSSSLELVGTGLLSLTGYDTTPGTFYLSSQAQENSKVSFSATSVVPEPASMLVLGAGLLGAAMVRRRRR